MQKFLKASKDIVFFLILAAVIPWITMATFFWSYMYIADKEMITFIKNNSDSMYNNGYTASLLAFCVTYILSVQVINPKIKNKIWRCLLYILINITLFFMLCLLP